MLDFFSQSENSASGLSHLASVCVLHDETQAVVGLEGVLQALTTGGNQQRQEDTINQRTELQLAF